MQFQLYIGADDPDPIIHRGLPPVDQSAEVAALRGIIAMLKTRAEARKADDATSVEGQEDLDLIATAPPAP